MAREQKVKSKASQAARQGAKTNGAVAPAPRTPLSIDRASEVQWPSWPVSKPGPEATPPPPGMRPVNALRPEQMVEIGYNQETGEPGSLDYERALPNEAKTGTVSFDLQDSRKKKKKRL
ncbi:hypothetical protein ccbrp13_46230 [Ktedonobacteria bacterium brp13]|nr:hypothetical protein ccbrp13_46230 [Ktedonobacteria bacterium brp13]